MFKKKSNIRIMSFFLAFIMILSLLPLNVFAAKPAPKPGAGINAGAGTGDGGSSDVAVGGWGANLPNYHGMRFSLYFAEGSWSTYLKQKKSAYFSERGMSRPVTAKLWPVC